MPITVKDNLFTLTTKHTAYVFSLEQGRYLVHRRYGKKKGELPPVERTFRIDFAPYRTHGDFRWWPDMFAQEVSFFGSGDFRTAAWKIRNKDGIAATEFEYKSHQVFMGKPDLQGLPQADGAGAKTLDVVMVDGLNHLELHLYYTVYFDCDVIARSALLKNKGKGDVKIEKSMSLTLDLPHMNFDMITLNGHYPYERELHRHPLHHGMQTVTSRRGATSHQANPFAALCSRGATEEKGECYGANLAWSGSFLTEAEGTNASCTRLQLGLGEENFGYLLSPGETFAAPEAVLTYTDKGIGQMTRNFHKFIYDRILPPSAKEKHPVVLNTWEACYFNIDQQVLLDFAEKAGTMGIDMLVMDDGWFGARDNDSAGLGDWFCNPRKFPHGLKPLADGIHERGVKFGIWIEPEMVNPDSDLYRAHPDWCLSVPGRAHHLSRRQLVLDMANPQVIDYLKESFEKVFDGVEIDYFKWDMNRHLCDIYSHAWPAERQEEVPYRHILGVYSLLDWFVTRYPKAIIETCSGGGGRYDLGMMKYGFQIWTSDNTKPYPRTMIQRASQIAYPAATMSCHVSNPKESMKSLDFRYKVAVGGMLGYELNVLKMSDEVNAEITRQIKEYHTFEDLIREGEYTCHADPFFADYSAYSYTDGRAFLLSVIEKEDTKPGQTKLIKLKGVKEDKIYTDTLSGKTYSGAELKQGLRFPLTGAGETATLIHLV